jgi:hypothetical protein
MVRLVEFDLRKTYKRIIEIDEIVGIYEVRIEGVSKPLKIKVKEMVNASGDRFVGIANLEIKGKDSLDYYRSIHPQRTKEEALRDAVSGFCDHLSNEAEIREIENW